MFTLREVVFSVLSTVLYFGSWFYCKPNTAGPSGLPSNSQCRLSPPQTPVPGLEVRKQQKAGPLSENSHEDHAQARSTDSLSPVPGIARCNTSDECVSVSFENDGAENRISLLPVGQFESSI